MTEPEPMSYAMTERGWKLAAQIWSRFVDGKEDIDLIAADFGMVREDITILMAIAFQGGVTRLEY